MGGFFTYRAIWSNPQRRHAAQTVDEDSVFTSTFANSRSNTIVFGISGLPPGVEVEPDVHTNLLYDRTGIAIKSPGTKAAEFRGSSIVAVVKVGVFDIAVDLHSLDDVVTPLSRILSVSRKLSCTEATSV